ncbi:cell surface protein [Lactobacillus curvatus]|nr:cell surface protein [Latilactobacillus curvatus]MSE24542.1 cell surface protein [Latilactobacillus curvatus]
MKFTKLTSSVLAGATLLSILAPTASFAATSTAGSQGVTDDNGGTPLPMYDKTVAGISFGDNTNNGNTGYLRLQMVPHTLDFGNHTLFDGSKPDFTADGLNLAKADNNRNPNYESNGTNQTAILNTEDAKLSDVKGKAWATVVDKQITRTGTGYDANTTPASGSWVLSVKSVDALTPVDDKGNPMAADAITGAKLSFADTQYGRTQEIFGLTGETQDQTWAKDSTATGVKADDKDVAKDAIVSNFSTPLAANGADITVASAADGEGQGANVFGWSRENIKLTMPKDATVKNAIYKANLTWTLSSTVA